MIQSNIKWFNDWLFTKYYIPWKILHTIWAHIVLRIVRTFWLFDYLLACFYKIYQELPEKNN